MSAYGKMSIVPGRVRLNEWEVRIADTCVQIAPDNPARKSLVAQNLATSAIFVLWVGGAGLQKQNTGTPSGAGVRVAQYGYSPIYEHGDAVWARSDTTDPIVVHVQEEVYVDEA